MLIWKKYALWVLATIPLVVANGKTSASQSGDNTAQVAISVLDNAWPKVSLNVVVLDKDSAPQKINGSEFHLFEDGIDRPLESITAADSPVSVAFLIDTSGSMYRRLSLEAGSIKAIAHALPVGSEIMAVEFADQTRLVLPFTPVSDADLCFLDHLNNRNSSGIFGAIVATENYFAAHAHNQRRALVLLSDGSDNASASRSVDAIRSIQWPGAPTFYSLFLPDPSAEKSDNRKGYKAMDSLARAGGGIASTLSRETDLVSAAARLAGIIRSQQILTFTAAETARDGKAHKLDLRLSAQNLRILALPVYYAPSK